MNIKTQSTFYIIGSLLIGILIGVFGTISYLRPAGDRIDVRERGSYKNKLLEVIEPSDQQRDTISALIGQFEEQMRIRHQKTMDAYRTLRDSMKHELNQHLTEDQKQKLETYHKERKERYERRKAQKKDNDKERMPW